MARKYPFKKRGFALSNSRIGRIIFAGAAVSSPVESALADAVLPYAVVDTNQQECMDSMGRPGCARSPAGQDAQHAGRAPAYRDNGDGTVTDLVTGLMWQKSFSRNSYSLAPQQAALSRLAGYSDWRVPSIKELYSLMDFSGATGRAQPSQTGAPSDARPYLNSRIFNFEYPSQGRYIDAQYVTSTAYTGKVMGGSAAFFGVNFADGRIKGYPQNGGPGGRDWYLRLVRGNPAYGKNDFVDRGDGVIDDRATGLSWSKADSGRGLDWEQALAWCEGLVLAGRDDWRLPNAKELHSIVDYSRSPAATNSAAIDPIFSITPVVVEEGVHDWPFFWTSTSHLDGRNPGSFAVYIAFGSAFGYFGGPNGQGMGGQGMGGQGMSGPPPGMPFPPPPGMGTPGMGPPGLGPQGMGRQGMGPPPGMMGGGMNQQSASAPLVDVHGAGAQRSSPKTGDERSLPRGAGPQGDVQRIRNFARCVRG